MNIILKPLDSTAELFYRLENAQLIKLFKPTVKTLELPKNTNAVDYVYTTDSQYGSHKLICVGLNSTNIRLNYHPDNEDFILINNTTKDYKPLFLIIGLQKKDKLQYLIDNNSLTENDILAIRLKFNDPLLSIFTMLKETVHCEITIADNSMQHPVFFVTEPTNLKQFFLDTRNYSFSVN